MYLGKSVVENLGQELQGMVYISGTGYKTKTMLNRRIQYWHSLKKTSEYQSYSIPHISSLSLSLSLSLSPSLLSLPPLTVCIHVKLYIVFADIHILSVATTYLCRILKLLDLLFQS